MSETQKRSLYSSGLQMIALSLAMGIIFYLAWSDIYNQVKVLEAQVEASLPLISDNALQFVAMFGLGLYLTWSVLFAHDPRKRYQGILILIGSIVALGVLASVGTFLPHIEPTVTNGVAFIVGILSGIYSEVAKTPLRDEPGNLHYISLEDSTIGRIKTVDGDVATFPAAAWGLFALIIAIVVGANLIIFTSDGQLWLKLIVVPVSGAFGYVLFSLVDFNLTALDKMSTKMEILGPTGSGKTLFIYGLYKAAQDRSGEFGALKPNENLQWLIMSVAGGEETERTSENPFGENASGAEWPVPSTDQLIDIGFTFTTGEYFKKVVKIGCLDHSGGLFGSLFGQTEDSEPGHPDEQLSTDGGTSEEDLDEVADWMSSPTELVEEEEDNEDSTVDSEPEPIQKDEETLDSEVSDWDPESGRSNSVLTPSEEAEILTREIEESDTLVFLLDIERLSSSIDTNMVTGTGVRKMIEIYQKASPERVVLVATKADYIIEPFQEENNLDDATPESSVVDYDDFVRFVTENLRQDRDDIDTLMDVTRVDEICPVYFKTEKNSEGERVPKSSTEDRLFSEKNNQLDGVGFDEALERILGKLEYK